MFYTFAKHSARGVVYVHDGGKLATRYSVCFIRLQSIPHVGLCMFMTAVNCQPGILYLKFSSKREERGAKHSPFTEQ